MEEDGFKLVKSKKSSKKNKKSTNIVLAEKIKEALSSEEISDFVRKLKIAQDEFEASEFFLDFLQSWTAFSKQHTQVDRIVCLGLGNFAQSPNSSSQVSSKFQLLLLLSFAKHANIANNDEVFVYDPILTCSEKTILTKLNLKLFETNQEGHYLFEKNTTVYFLPHCPKQLLNNLLWSNWDNLDFVYIIGNSFKNINLNFSANQLQSVKYIQQVSDVIKETNIKNSFQYKDIFNNLSFHRFELTKKLPPKSPTVPKYSEDLEFVQKNHGINIEGLTLSD